MTQHTDSRGHRVSGGDAAAVEACVTGIEGYNNWRLDTMANLDKAIEADAEFAWIEGEGDRSFEYWWNGHIAFWKREAEREGFVFSEDLPACFEQFELFWVPDQAVRA